MNQLEMLITKAGSIVGSEYKLAKALGIPPTRLSSWKYGRQKCTPPDRARIAAFAGEDALQELVRATIEDNAGTVRGEQLKKVLGKPSRQTGAVLNSALPLAISLAFGIDWFYTMYKKVNRFGHFPSIRITELRAMPSARALLLCN